MKDILVIVTGGAYDESRVVTATAIAKHFDAQMTVAVVNELPDPQLYAADPSVGVAPIDTQLQDEAMERGVELKAKIEQRLADAFAGANVILLHELHSRVSDSVAELARLNDLLITTLPADSSKPELMSALLDKALLEGACGILCLPHGIACSPVADHAVLAWNGSREASRSMQAALPLLKAAKKVTVLLVDRPLRRAGASFRPGDEIVMRLKHHGIDAGLVRVASEGLSTADAITAEVGRLNADLLVMGAQAEGGLMQWFKSSVSRKVLADAKLPLLIAH